MRPPKTKLKPKKKGFFHTKSVKLWDPLVYNSESLKDFFIKYELDKFVEEIHTSSYTSHNII